MSFSSQVKEELSKTSNLAKKDQVKYELAGYLISSNSSRIGRKYKFSTENEYNINRFAKLLKNINIEDYKIEIKGKIFSIEYKISDINIDDLNLSYCKNMLILNEYNRNDSLDKALIRGVFLGSGYINNPEKKYHLELNFNNESNLNTIYEILKSYMINTKKLIKEKSFALYIKEGEEISKFLAFIGGNNAVLKFEEARVLRDTSNNLNRLVNCETANFTKTIQAGQKQIEDIKYIKAKKKFGELSENLQLIANIRLEHPEASLTEIVALMDNTISKSGVSHRLTAISKFAEELRNN